MPSAEEFAPRGAAGPMTPERMQALRDRARAVRQAQATGAPIPGTDYQTTAPTPVPVQPPAQLMQECRPAVPAPMPAAAQSELDLVRQRFKLASYYEALIAEPVFGDDVLTDPYAAQVHAEVTAWASNRMAELAGIRDNPEGFLDEEVQLLKALAQNLGSEGVRALLFLADRVLNPPAATPPAPPTQVTTPPSAPTPTSAEEPEDDQSSSAMALSVAPAQVAPPTQPQVAPAKPKQPRVRRARVPGAPAVQPGAEAPAETPRRGRRTRSADPLEAGRAIVASQAQPPAPNAPTAQPSAPAPGPVAMPTNLLPPASHATPVPMPKGLGMTMAMEQKAGEALRDAKVIETTGGGVL